MSYLRSFKRFTLIGLALLGLSVSSVNAALVLHHSGGGPVMDTDGDFVGDISFPGDSFVFDVVYDSIGATDFSGGDPGIWGFTVGVSLST